MLHFALIVGGLALLFVGAEALVRGASALALRLGLSTLLVGLTVVAFGTSAPELIVSAEAALNEVGGIAVGNVVGSNIANVALILGVSALIRPLRVQAQLVRLDIPLLIAASLVLSALLLDGAIGRLEGLGLVSGLVAYLVFSYRVARRAQAQLTLYEEIDSSGAASDEALPTRGSSFLVNGLFVGAGLVMLVLGANWLVSGAVAIAENAGVSQTVIGLTLVAIGTSIPELATSVVASARGADDLAVGNVVGSNLFNVLGILGVAALIHPLHAPDLGWKDLAVLVATALLILPLARSGFVLSRTEGALLTSGYVAYVVFLLAA
jgi:cation:H+ antiporter